MSTLGSSQRHQAPGMQAAWLTLPQGRLVGPAHLGEQMPPRWLVTCGSTTWALGSQSVLGVPWSTRSWTPYFLGRSLGSHLFGTFSFLSFFFKILFIFGCVGSSLRCAGFSLQWLLVAERGFSSCGMWAQ